MGIFRCRDGFIDHDRGFIDGPLHARFDDGFASEPLTVLNSDIRCEDDRVGILNGVGGKGSDSGRSLSFNRDLDIVTCVGRLG